MPVIKECRCCGSELEFYENERVKACVDCGAMNEYPQMQGLMLENFRSALHMLGNQEFCSAEDGFRYVLNVHPRNAEALWGRLLCQYGAAFTQAGGQRQYKVHFPQATALREQPEFLLACELAAPQMREQLEQEAAGIDNANRRILDLARQQPDFDVFLCHQPMRSDGSYTEDYNRACAVYNLLTKQGCRVFFAPVEMAEVTGSEERVAAVYQALNTSHTMLVICSDVQTPLSGAVQGEWRRFLRREGDCQLIPLLYGGMKIYDLPQEFRRHDLTPITMDQEGREALVQAVTNRQKEHGAGRNHAAPRVAVSKKPEPKPAATKKRGGRNALLTVVIVVLALLAAATMGLIVMSLNRTWDVTVRVHTQDAIIRAKLGDVELPAATPGPEGYVEYTASLREGEYSFAAMSEHGMSSLPAVLHVGEADMLEVTLPTPTPAPVTVDAQEGQWAYRIADDDPMLVSQGAAEVIANPMQPGQLVVWALNVTQGRAPEGVEAFLVRDGYALPLDLSSGATAVELTRGDYELVLCHAGTSEELTRLPVDVSDHVTTMLDAAPYEYYAAHLADKPDPASFYYISDADTPLHGSDVADLSLWARELPELFGDYAQYEVTFALAEGLPEDVQVTLNGFVWTDFGEATFGRGQTAVEVKLTSNGVVFASETIVIDPLADTRYILGQQVIEALHVRWNGVDGLLRVDDCCYLLIRGSLYKVTEADWTEMVADTQIFPSQARYAPFAVTLHVPGLISAAGVEQVSIQQLPIPAMTESTRSDVSLSYSLEASAGSWEVEMTLADSDETMYETICFSSGTTDYKLSAVEQDVDRAIEYSVYRPAAFVQRLDGSIEYVFRGPFDEPDISAGEWLRYASRYSMGGYAGDWTFHPVRVVLDRRVRPDRVTVTVNERTTALVNVNGEWMLDVSAVTGQEYDVWVHVTNDAGEKISCGYVLTAGEEYVLLQDRADEWVDNLRYASIDGGEPILLAGDPSLLTEEAVEAAKSFRTGECSVTLSVENYAEWQHLRFGLRPVAADVSLIPLASMTDGCVVFAATWGDYEVWVLENPDMGYPQVMLATIHVRKNNEVCLLDGQLATLGSEYRQAQNVDVRIPIDERINIGMSSDLYVQVDFAEDVGAFLDEPTASGDGVWHVTVRGALPDGGYAMQVNLLNVHDMSVSPQRYTYMLTLADGKVSVMNEAGVEVPALLSDVADEAQSDACWWGLTPDSLELLPGAMNVWVLNEAALAETQKNVQLVYLKYPEGDQGVSAYMGRDWQFALQTGENVESVSMQLPQEVYYSYPADRRYQPMYLTQNILYRLVVTVPENRSENTFDLGGIVIIDGVPEVLPGVNDKQILTAGNRYSDGTPVIELVLGYYGPEYADFYENETVKPSSTAIPTPEPTAAPTLTPENCRHVNMVWEVEEATCTRAGSETAICRDCGYTNSYATPKKGHSYTSKVTKSATCTASGVRTYTCSLCGSSYTEEISARGHDYTSEVTKSATCTASGVRTYTCSLCGGSYTESISARGHNYTSEVTKKVTCSEDGATTFTCTRCSDQYVKWTPATGHNWSDWVVVKAATCTTEGERDRTCLNGCGRVGLETIPATGHSYTSAVTMQPVCGTDGVRTYTCARCGDSYTELIAAPSHSWSQWKTYTERTCARDGVYVRTCSKCGQNETRIVEASGEHTYVNGVCTKCLSRKP